MIVVDANVMVSALRSSRGASHLLLRSMIEGSCTFAISPAIAFEYEDVLKRPGVFGKTAWLTDSEIDVILDAAYSKAVLVSPAFRFRPFLADPGDDIYIECAFAAGAKTIVSNDRHFKHPDVNAFGLTVMSAGEYIAAMLSRR